MTEIIVTVSGIAIVFAWVILKYVFFACKKNTENKFKEYLSLQPQQRVKIMSRGSVKIATIIEKEIIGYTANVEGKIINFTFSEYMGI